MELVRTSLRLNKKTKINTEKKAAEMGITMQTAVNNALDHYLDSLARKKSQDIVFHDKEIDERLDNLTRDDYYED